jgi:hypothetical protein
MLMLICDTEVQNEMRSRLQSGASFDLVTSWDELEDGDVLGYRLEPVKAVAVIPWVDKFALRRIELLRSSLPVERVLVIVRREAENARRIASSGVDEIAWLEQPTSELLAAIRRLSSPRYLHQLGEEIAQMSDVPDRLRRGLILACNSPRPITSVSALASVTRCHRSTLLLELRTALAPRMTLRLEDLLSWFLLMRALELKADGVSWESAGSVLNVYPNTLRRIAKRLTRRRLRALDALGPDWLFRIVRDWVLTQFAGWPVPDSTKCSDSRRSVVEPDGAMPKLCDPVRSQIHTSH